MKHTLLIITALMLVVGCGSSEKETEENMVFVEGGTFQMGSNISDVNSAHGDSDEKPVHTVTVSSFYMDKTEVTQAEYRKVMGKNPSHFSGCDDCPVENVSWYNANEYAKKVGKRLPTEAEWEYAARGGNKSKGYRYSGSNGIDAVGWYYDNSDDLSPNSAIAEFENENSHKTHPVAQKQPNELGLYDMSGNVYEWCSDWYGSYSSSPQNNPQGPNSGTRRVLRGGGCRSSGYFGICRVANRFRDDPASGFNFGAGSSGFRLVLSQD
jgi:formylglycine-generating enzyme required for sulfatase activity